MQKKWKVAMMIVAPILVGGTFYGLAATGSPQQEAAQSNMETGSNVSYEIISSEPLTAEELATLQNVQPASVTAQSTGNGTEQTIDQNVIDANNPFVVIAPAKAPAATNGTTASAAVSAPAQPDSAPFDLTQMKKGEFKTSTTQGELNVQFETDEGELKLKGELAGRKWQAQGEQAVAILAQLFQSYQLTQAFDDVLHGNVVTLDTKVLSALETMKIELKDGRKIETKTKKKSKSDNGLHKGWAKKEEKEQGPKKNKNDEDDHQNENGNQNQND